MKNLLRYAGLKVNAAQCHNVPSNAYVVLDGVMFKEGVVSKIEFVKHKFEDDTDSLFISLYMGNIKICNVLTNDDYVIEKEEGSNLSFWIRKAKDYDY